MTHFIREKLLPGINFLTLWLLVLVTILAAGYQLIMLQGEGRFARWERLPVPPVSPFELASSYFSPAVRGEDDSVYLINIYAPPENWTWEQYELPSWETPYENHCALTDIPRSWVSAPAAPLVLCNEFRRGPESAASYLAMDEEGQLWVRVNYNDMWGAFMQLGLLFIVALIVSPLMTVWLMRALVKWVRVYTETS